MPTSTIDRHMHAVNLKLHCSFHHQEDINKGSSAALLIYFLLNFLFFLIVDPRIIQNPENQSVATGEDITFTVEATGDDLQFQWQKDGEDIDSSEPRFSSLQTDSTSTLRIESVKKSDQGHYSCLVKNPVGKISSVAELIICKLIVPVFIVKVGGYGKTLNMYRHAKVERLKCWAHE